MKNCLKIIVLTIAYIGACNFAFATHQKAAEITYKYISGYTYEFIITTYTYSESIADRPFLTINWGDGTTEVLARSEYVEIADLQTIINSYHGTHSFSGPGSYYISFEDPNRNGGVVNIPNSITTPMYVETLLVISPWGGNRNNSVRFLNRPIDDNACLGQSFVHNPSVYDPDGDSLSFSLIPCKTTGGEDIIGFSYPYASEYFIIDSFGNLMWEVPTQQGEYNTAILIREWRNKVKIGEITRDMQITVQVCDNIAPKLICPKKICVEAGNPVEFDITALDFLTDSDINNVLSISFTSELLENSIAGQKPIIKQTYVSEDSIVAKFIWRPDIGTSRKQVYRLYIRVTDNGEPNLSDLEVIDIHVIAPAVKNAEANTGKKLINLQWDKTKSKHAIGYSIYRKTGNENSSFDNCQRGIDNPAYSLIKTINNIDSIKYIDTSNLKEGLNYCYSIVCNFADKDESYASEDACAEILNIAPLMTNISVEKTHSTEGILKISWQTPRIIDTNNLEEYKYRLYKGIYENNMLLYKIFDFKDSITIYDSNLNTFDHLYYYSVAIDSNISYNNTNIWLQAIPYSKKIILSWTYQHAWINKSFNIHRLNTATNTFVKIENTKNLFYIDNNLDNGTEYTYFIEAIGSYYSDYITKELINKSNTNSTTPKVAIPCKPFLFVAETSCEPFENTLIWSFDSLYEPDIINSNIPDLWDCYEDLSHFLIYYRRAQDKEFELLDEVDTYNYIHENPPSYFGYYKIAAVNTNGVEGEGSKEVFIDNNNCFKYDLPNVFTPNSDGVNDVFKAFPNQYVESFNITIFNRAGSVVYKSNDPNFQWNGQFKGSGKDCPDGAYFYVAEFTSDELGITFRRIQNGSITLLR